MNLKKIIREELGSGNPLDWMMGEPKFNPNEILQKNKEKKVVALWFGDIDEYLSDFFNDFVKKNGYQYVDFAPKNLLKGNVKGLTFYPNGSVGFFRGRESWDGYLNGVYGYEYVDIDPSNIYVMDLSDTNLQEQISLKEDKKKDDGFDWVRQTTINVNDFLNKAFYFDPIAEEGDKDYEKLIDYLNQIGFKSEYNTPSSLYGDDQAVGLYAYRDNSGDLVYVYTTHIYEDEDGTYWEHIRDFATRNSEEEGDNLVVVDARDFVNSYLH